ncbi:nicotinate (nicotinamide) nucleotide adenylyltransferase [Nitriliruptoraceae bacterium ZYF776]|nr:nicotinate (nicotinamide) nucleotide adenylyltransferase [Profundirhabdus halotolerans]
MGRRIGLLGGTFDPPHLGHLVVAECARVELPLDEVRLLVAGEPWMKGTGPSSAADRLALVEAAVRGDEHLHVDDREVRRGGATYTADTLADLHAEDPGTSWFFLLGEDAAAGLGRWHRVEEAFALATFVVVTRPGHAPPPSGELPADVIHLEVPQLEVSSTELRERYRTDRATRYLVPDAVDDLVRRTGRYGARGGRG